MATSLEDVSFTEFIQRPTATTGRLASTRALRLRRRDADDLVVMPADRAEREGEVIDATARLLASLLHRNGGPALIRGALPDVFPWVRFLPLTDVNVLAEEFIEVVVAATALGNLAPIAQLLVEWRHTAEVHADPQLHAFLTNPLGEDHGLAEPPDVGVTT